MYYITYLFLCLFYLTALTTTAQNAKVYIRNSPNNSSNTSVIQLKWYDQETIFRGLEMNVYRREIGDIWKKLNNTPIKKGAYPIPVNAFTKDTTLKAYVHFADKIPSDSVRGFFLLTLLLKSFQSSEFAKYAGVMYEDVDVEKGKQYQYKVSLIEKGKESEIGMSGVITCGKYIPPVPPQDLQIKPKKKKTEFKWKVETERYYGINIYRTASDSTKEIKLTPIPIMVSKKPNGNGEKTYSEVMYTDNHLREDITYTYRLTALDFFGEETEFTPGIEAYIADSTPPPAPLNLKYEVNKYEVNLAWEEAPNQDLTGYYIYKSKKSTGPYNKLNTELIRSGNNKFKEESQSGGFYYYVSAADKAGNESPSNLVFVHVRDIIPPLPPQNLSVRADTGKIYLSWLSNKEEDLMGYQIYRSINDNDTTHFVLLNSTPSGDAFYVDNLPKNIKNTFIYKVVAVDSSFNRSKPSLTKGGKMPDITPPEQPLIVNAFMKDDYMMIEWISNKDNDLWGYNLYKSSGKDSANFKQINVNLLPAHSKHFTDRNTEESNIYHYYLEAIDSSGNHSIPSGIYTIRNTNNGSTNSLGLTSAKAKINKKNNQVHIQWEVKSKDLLGSVVYRKESESDTMQPLTGMLSSQEYVDKDISNTKTYLYEIRIYSSSGKIERSSLLRIETEK